MLSGLVSDFGRSLAKWGIERIKGLCEWATEGTRLLSADEDDQGYIRQLWANHGGSCPPLLQQIKRLEDLLEQVKLAPHRAIATEGYFSIDCNTRAWRSASLMMLLSQVVSRRSICPAPLRSMAMTPRFTGLPSFVHSKPPP